MKNYLKVLLLLTVAIGSSNLCYGSKKSTSNNLEGTWVYSAPDVPDGFCKGKLEFINSDGVLKVNIKPENGHSIGADDLKVQGNKVSFNTEVDYETVSVTLEFVGEILKGKILTYDGDFSVSMKKEKKNN